MPQSVRLQNSRIQCSKVSAESPKVPDCKFQVSCAPGASAFRPKSSLPQKCRPQFPNAPEVSSMQFVPSRSRAVSAVCIPCFRFLACSLRRARQLQPFVLAPCRTRRRRTEWKLMEGSIEQNVRVGVPKCNAKRNCQQTYRQTAVCQTPPSKRRVKGLSNNMLGATMICETKLPTYISSNNSLSNTAVAITLQRQH